MSITKPSQRAARPFGNRASSLGRNCLRDHGGYDLGTEDQIYLRVLRVESKSLNENRLMRQAALNGSGSETEETA